MRRRSLPEGDRRDFERRGKAGSALTRASRSSRRGAPRHRFSRGQQPNKDDRGGGAKLCRKRRSAPSLPATANPAGQGTAVLSSAIGGLATVSVGRRTAKRFGGQAASAGFGRSRSQADAGVDDERAAQDGFGVRAVIAEDDGRDSRGPRRLWASLSPAEEHEAFSRRRAGGWLRPSCGAGTRFIGIVVVRRNGRIAWIPVPEYAQPTLTRGFSRESVCRLLGYLRLAVEWAPGNIEFEDVRGFALDPLLNGEEPAECGSLRAFGGEWILGSSKRRSRGC